MPDAARDAFDDTLRQAIEAGDSTPPDPTLAGAVAAYHKIESLFALLRGPADVEPPPEMPPERIGRYLVRETLGHGAFGTVYLADDPELGRQVAIKLPRAGAFATPGDTDAFLAEARLTARLNHPGIVAVYDAGRQGDRAYIVIEYVPGQTLDELARGERPVAVRVAEWLAAVADALAYAHQQGFVHRDLKPSNILIDAAGRPRVADFGLAVSDDAGRQLAGQVAGTPAYMSPEQVRGESHQLDGRSDIWSLGVIGYELLTGRQPFWRGDVAACLDDIVSREPKPPRQIDAALPPELERIVLKCMAKRPTDRYTTAADLATDLRRWLARDRRARRRSAAMESQRIHDQQPHKRDPTSGRVSTPCEESSSEATMSPGSAKGREPTRNEQFFSVLRWVACGPAAVAAGVVAHFLVLIGNRLSMELYLMNPDSAYGKLACLAISSVLFGAAVVFVACAVAPAFRKTVAFAAAGIVLFFSGLATYQAVLDADWWAAYQVVWANIGAITTACHGVDAG